MDVFIARQPIFDRKQQVYGYELLYRLGTDNFYPGSDGDRATAEVIANSFLLIGMEPLTCGKRAFINFTGNLLKNEIPALLPKDSVAIEILENIDVDQSIVDACQKLKRLGYSLVLDDFVLNDKYLPLIKLADIIKIDFFESTTPQTIAAIRRFGTGNVQLLAEKVEDQEAFRKAYEMGFHYFQGYFFSEPVILSRSDIPGYKLSYLRMLQEVNLPEFDFDRLEEIIKQDVSLSYKLLKYINSAAFGMRSKIKSIKHALVMLGTLEVKKWANLIILRGLGEDKPDEIMTSSIIRARFGELLALPLGMPNRSSDLFLMGIFSMIGAILNRPMGDILSELPISEEIKDALLGQEGHYQDIYQLIVSYEKANWETFMTYADRLGLDSSIVPGLYVQSLTWANQVMRW